MIDEFQFNVMKHPYEKEGCLGKEDRVSITKLYDVPIIVTDVAKSEFKDKFGNPTEKTTFKFCYYTDSEHRMHWAISDGKAIYDRLNLIREQFPVLLYITHIPSKTGGNSYGAPVTPKEFFEMQCSKLGNDYRKNIKIIDPILYEIIDKYY